MVYLLPEIIRLILSFVPPHPNAVIIKEGMGKKYLLEGSNIIYDCMVKDWKIRYDDNFDKYIRTPFWNKMNDIMIEKGKTIYNTSKIWRDRKFDEYKKSISRDEYNKYVVEYNYWLLKEHKQGIKKWKFNTLFADDEMVNDDDFEDRAELKTSYY